MPVRFLGGHKAWLGASPTLPEALALQQSGNGRSDKGLVFTGLLGTALPSVGLQISASHSVAFHGLAKVLTRLTLKLQQSVHVFIFVSTEPGRNNFSANVRRFFCKECACNKLSFVTECLKWSQQKLKT